MKKLRNYGAQGTEKNSQDNAPFKSLSNELRSMIFDDITQSTYQISNAHNT